MLHHPKVFYPHPDLIVQRAEGLGHRRRCCGLSGSGPFWFTHPVSPYLSSVSSHLTLWLLVTVWRSVEEDRPRRGKGSQKSHKQSVSLTYTASLVLLKASVTPQSRVVEPDERTTLEMLNKQRDAITEKDPRRNWGEPLVEIEKFKEQTNLEMLAMGPFYANVSADWMQLKL